MNGNSRKRRQQIVGAAADFTDQHAILSEPAPRTRQNPSDDVESIVACLEGASRFVPILRRHAREVACIDVGRVGHDQIERRRFETVEDIGAHHGNPIFQPMQRHVAPGQRQCRVVDVRQHDLGVRKSVRTRDADASRTRTQVENSIWETTQPRREFRRDQLGDRRSRNQHPGLDQITAPGKPRLADQIRNRHVVHDAPLEQAHEFAPLHLGQTRGEHDIRFSPLRFRDARTTAPALRPMDCRCRGRSARWNATVSSPSSADSRRRFPVPPTRSMALRYPWSPSNSSNRAFKRVTYAAGSLSCPPSANAA